MEEARVPKYERVLANDGVGGVLLEPALLSREGGPGRVGLGWADGSVEEGQLADLGGLEADAPASLPGAGLLLHAQLGTGQRLEPAPQVSAPRELDLDQVALAEAPDVAPEGPAADPNRRCGTASLGWALLAGARLRLGLALLGARRCLGSRRRRGRALGHGWRRLLRRRRIAGATGERQERERGQEEEGAVVHGSPSLPGLRRFLGSRAALKGWNTRLWRSP